MLTNYNINNQTPSSKVILLCPFMNTRKKTKLEKLQANEPKGK